MVSRLISVMKGALPRDLKNSKYIDVNWLNLVSTEPLKHSKLASTIATQAEPTKLLETPRWKLCHKSVKKNSMAYFSDNGKPFKIVGGELQATCVCSVWIHKAVGDMSSNGIDRSCWAPVSTPARQRWQMPLHAVREELWRGTWEKLRSNPPNRTKAGRSPFVPICTKWSLMDPSFLVIPSNSSSFTSSAYSLTSSSCASGCLV